MSMLLIAVMIITLALVARGLQPARPQKAYLPVVVRRRSRRARRDLLQ